jgi:hypothetical protein
LLVALDTGCKRSTSVVGPESAKGAVPKNYDAEEFAFKGLNGEEVHSAGGEPVALPADFPADVAIYPEATVTMTATGKKEMSVTLNTIDSIEKVEAFYKKKLKEDGWKLDDAIKQPQFLQTTKKGRSLSVDIRTQSGKTTVCLTIAKGKVDSAIPEK